MPDFSFYHSITLTFQTPFLYSQKDSVPIDKALLCDKIVQEMDGLYCKLFKD